MSTEQPAAPTAPLSMTEKSIRFALLKQRKEELEAMVGMIDKVLAEIGPAIFGDFADSGTASIRLEGKHFSDGQDRIVKPNPKFKGTIKNEAAFFEFLRKCGNGALIKSSVHHTALEKLITEYKAQNKELPPKEVLDIFTVETVKVTRAPKGRDKKESGNDGDSTNDATGVG